MGYPKKRYTTKLYRNKAFKQPRKVLKKKKFVKGRDRTSGYYGRFNKPIACRDGEKKFWDTGLTIAEVPTGMQIHNLTVVAQGNGESQRIGRKITIRDINVRYTLRMFPSVSAFAGNVIRIMIVQDRQTNGTEFAPGDLLEDNDLHSFRNLANSGRFKVLWTTTIDLSATAGVSDTGYAANAKSVIVNLKVNIPMEYDGVSGAIGTVRSNNIYFTTQTLIGEEFIANGNARIRFTDY